VSDIEPASTALTDTGRLRIIAGVLICMLLAALDQTIVAPVIPTLGAALGGSEYISWIVSAYFLTATAVVPLYGKIADIRGRRPTLLTAIAIFVAGSIICALATSMQVLVIGRAVQGVGGGGLMALAQTVIADLMPPKERGKASGYIAIMWGAASIGGPVVGGLVAQHLHWSLIFWLNLPLAAFALSMASDALRVVPWQRREHNLDVAGAILVIVASVSLMLALALAPQPQFGWSSPAVIALVTAAAILVPIIARHFRRASEPLIPIDVLASSVVSLATTSVFFGMAANVALTVFVPLYLELALGLSASRAGVALVALMIGTVVGANAAGRTMGHIVHYKRLPLLGLAIATAGLAVLALRSGSIGLVQVELVLFIVGAGLGTQFPVTTVAVQNAVDVRDIGVATGVVGFMRSLGSSLGLAVVGAVGSSSGIAINTVEGRNAVDARPVVAADFSPVFMSIAVCLAIGFVALAKMPELPLRGRDAHR
jgi:EmrB/QacA subfamily drug resistance transporter